MLIDGVLLTKLAVIDVPLGSVYHAMKNQDPGFSGFGEAYFSQVAKDAIKGWKCHQKMTLNLVVPIGAVKFMLVDTRNGLSVTEEVTLSPKHYSRLTIPPKIWVSFQGLENTNLILNIANIPHDPSECDHLSLDTTKLPNVIAK